MQFPDDPARSASAADAFLQSHGIVARRFALDDFRDKLRFTVGLDDEMEQATALLENFMER